MKNPVKLTAVIILSFLFSGCSVWQYVGVDSRLYRNDNNEFVVENDTLLLKYSFSGYNFPVNVIIYNRLQQPLYFDNSRSTVIINGSQANFPFSFEGQPSFIAPGSYVTVSSMPLTDKFIETNGFITSNGSSPASGAFEVTNFFSEDLSPLKFRVILAVTANENYSDPVFYDHSFWAGGVRKSMENPKNSPIRSTDMFFIKKSTGAGKALSWTAIIGIILLGGLTGGAGQ